MRTGRVIARLLRLAVGLIVFVSFQAGDAHAQDRVTVTVRQLFDRAHRIEVTAGDEVVWADPHFERVWFPSGADSPKVERVAGELRTRFAKPGTYRGAFTVRAGHGTNDVYDMTVVVNSRSQ